MVEVKELMNERVGKKVLIEISGTTSFDTIGDALRKYTLKREETDPQAYGKEYTASYLGRNGTNKILYIVERVNKRSE